MSSVVFLVILRRETYKTYYTPEQCQPVGLAFTREKAIEMCNEAIRRCENWCRIFVKEISSDMSSPTINSDSDAIYAVNS